MRTRERQAARWTPFESYSSNRDKTTVLNWREADGFMFEILACPIAFRSSIGLLPTSTRCMRSHLTWSIFSCCQKPRV